MEVTSHPKFPIVKVHSDTDPIFPLCLASLEGNAVGSRNKFYPKSKKRRSHRESVSFHFLIPPS